MYMTRFTEPEAVGYLMPQHVSCGKRGCKCQRGESHGPYWYLRFRRLEGGAWRQRKRYVPAERVETVRKWLRRNKDRDRAPRRLLRRARRLRSALRACRRGGIGESDLKEICNGLG